MGTSTQVDTTKTAEQRIWNFDLGKDIKEEELDGRKFIIVPMTMILEGVHTGSQGPVYYSVEELAKTPKMWNMKPILIEHPFRGDTATELEVYKRQAVGMIMNTYFDSDEGKLKAEAWIDKDLAQNKYPQLLEHIESRLPMEVSTGLFSELILEPGVWKGEEYKGRIVNIRADHLAILPRKQGACSLSDGAGLLINQSFDDCDVVDGKERLMVFTSVINMDYPPGTPIAEGVVPESVDTSGKPRLKNSMAEVAKMTKPIQSAAQPYELDTDDFRIIIVPKTAGLDMDKLDIPQLSLDSFSEVDEDELPIPEKQKSSIQDNAKILSPAEKKKDQEQDVATGGKDHYMELKDKQIRNSLVAALIRRRVKNRRTGLKKKITKRVKNAASYPDFSLDPSKFGWDDRPDDVRFTAQQSFYDNLVVAPRISEFISDIDDQDMVIRELSSILLHTFKVSNVQKIKSLMEFAKESPVGGVFSSDDVALVDHTIGQLEQAKEDKEKLEKAKAEYQTRVKYSSGNEGKHLQLATKLTGLAGKTFSPVNTDLVDYREFDQCCDRQLTGEVKNTTHDKIAAKLNITDQDTPGTLKAKKILGKAAITLGKYAEKGLQSDVHIDLLLGDSRDQDMRKAMTEVKDLLEYILYKTEPKETSSLATKYPNMLGESSSMNTTYETCRNLADKLVSPRGFNKKAVKDSLVKWLGSIIGTSARKEDPTGSKPTTDKGQVVETRISAHPVCKSCDHVDTFTKLPARKEPTPTLIAKIMEGWMCPVCGSRAYDWNPEKTVSTKQKWVLKRGKIVKKSTGEGSQTPKGLVQSAARQYGVDEAVLRLYAEQLINMFVTRKIYDHSVAKARTAYEAALRPIKRLNMTPEAKEEFVGLSDKLFDPQRQAMVTAAVKNTDRLEKFLLRHQLGGWFGEEGGLDVPLMREMLEAIGIIPNKTYDSSDAWLAVNKPDETAAGDSSLVSLVSSLPDSRSFAQSLLLKNPDLVRKILGTYTAVDEEDKKKLDSFLNLDDFKTRGELLAAHDPKVREMNEKILQLIKDLEDYDPLVGFTPEQKEALKRDGSSASWLSEWGADSKTTAGFKEFYNLMRKQGLSWEDFKPSKHLIPHLLNFIYKRLYQDTVAHRRKDDTDTMYADKLYTRYHSLGPEVAQAIVDAPEVSPFIDQNALAPKRYNELLTKFQTEQGIEEEREKSEIKVKLVLIYQEFRERNIAAKARVLLDRFVMFHRGDAVDGEVAVTNSLSAKLNQVSRALRQLRAQNI